MNDKENLKLSASVFCLTINQNLWDVHMYLDIMLPLSEAYLPRKYPLCSTTLQYSDQ
jgi:hypothetical protein